MFREAKHAVEYPYKVNNQIKLNRLARKVRERFWTPYGTMRYENGVSHKEAQEARERAEKSAENWF